MSGIVYFLLFLWSIVQTVAFWLPIIAIVEACKASFNSDAFIFFGLIFIVVNLIVGFITIFVIGQYDKEDEEKHLFFKSVVNGLCGSIRLPMHILIRIIAMFNPSLPLDWGAYDSDNWVSTIIYSATLLDIEPSWGDFPERISDHESSPKYIRKTRKQIASKSHHALRPFVVENDGRVHGPDDVLAQARSVAEYCSTYVESKGNQIDIQFGARLSGNTLYFKVDLRQSRSKPFSSQYDLESFQDQVIACLEMQQREIANLMKKYAENTEFDREYSVEFEKGSWDI